MKALLACLLMVLATTALQAQDDITRHPGYFDLRLLTKGIGSDPTVEINLKGFLLRMAAAATRINDPDLADIMKTLELVWVEKYALPGSAQVQKVREQNRLMSEQLLRKGWQRIVRLRENDEDLHLLARPNGDKIIGLAAFSIEKGNEAIFVNIIGEMTPEQIGRLGAHYAIHPLDSLRLPQSQ